MIRYKQSTIDTTTFVWRLAVAEIYKTKAVQWNKNQWKTMVNDPIGKILSELSYFTS